MSRFTKGKKNAEKDAEVDPDLSQFNVINTFAEYIVSFFWDLISTSQFVAKIEVDNFMKKNIPQYEQKGFPLVCNDIVKNRLEEGFNFSLGGVHVLAAPPGSGKSTYLRTYAQEHINSGGRVQLFGSELQGRDYFDSTLGGVKRKGYLFEILPPGSVIIIDQVEHAGKLSKDIQGLIRHLALESRRKANCNIIVASSDIVVIKECLSLNGNDKIKQLGISDDFRWKEAHVEEFITKSCGTWSEDDRKALFTLGIKAGCPAFLHNVVAINPEGLPPDLTRIEKMASRYEEAWKLFEENEI